MPSLISGIGKEISTLTFFLHFDIAGGTDGRTR